MVSQQAFLCKRKVWKSEGERCSCAVMCDCVETQTDRVLRALACPAFVSRNKLPKPNSASLQKDRNQQE